MSLITVILLVGYVLNIYRLFSEIGSDRSELQLILRIVGVLFFPLGGIVGFFKWGDRGLL